MYEIVIEPENNRNDSCYTQLPFVPQRGAEVVVERWRQRTRTFLSVWGAFRTFRRNRRLVQITEESS